LSAATMLAMTSRSAGRMSGQSSRISFGLNESCNFLRLAPRRLEDRCRLGRRLDVCGRRAAVEPVLDHVLEKREMPAERLERGVLVPELDLVQPTGVLARLTAARVQLLNLH